MKYLRNIFETLKFNKDRLIPSAIFIFILSIYVHNLSPSVYSGDSGDFLSASSSYGVPHPSGYPLITLIGILFMQLLPFGVSPAWKFGFASSLVSSISIVLIYLTVKYISNNRILSICAAFTLAFAYPFWLYAEVVEVMALHYFFIIVLIYLTVKYIYLKDINILYLLALFGGLSLSNNLSIILIFPGILISILIADKKTLLNLSNLIKLLFISLIGLLPYIYIPLSASKNPAVNTGYAANIKNFIYLITRHYYGWSNVNEKNTEILYTNFRFYLDYWFTYLNWVILILGFLGLIYLIKNKLYNIFVLFITSLFFIGPFFMSRARIELANFGNVGVFEKFFPQTIIIIVYLVPLGVILIKNSIIRYIKNPLPSLIISSSLILIAAIQPFAFFLKNFKKLDFSNIWTVDNFAKDVMFNKEKESIILLQDDSMVYSVLYLQNGFNYRNDIRVPGIHEGFTPMLESRFSNVSDIISFKIDHQNTMKYEEIIAEIPKLLNRKAIYTNEPLPLPESSEKIIFVPEGLLFKLVYEKDFKLKEKDYLASVENNLSNFHLQELLNDQDIVDENIYLSHIKGGYYSGLIQISNFIRNIYKDNNTADMYLKRAEVFNPVKEDTDY